MKRLALIACCAILLATSALSQTPVANPDPATREQATRIIQLMDVENQMRAVSAGMKQQMQPMILEDIKKKMPNAPPEAIKEVAAAFDEMFDGMYKNFSEHEMQTALVDIYQRHVTRAEADAVIAFYSSPEGQSFLKKAPLMGTDTIRVILPNLRAQGEQLGKKLEVRLEEIKKKYGLTTAQ
jgi:uncharacterized protein